MRSERSLYSLAKWVLQARHTATANSFSLSLAELPEPLGKSTASSIFSLFMVESQISTCSAGLSPLL